MSNWRCRAFQLGNIRADFAGRLVDRELAVAQGPIEERIKCAVGRGTPAHCVRIVQNRTLQGPQGDVAVTGYPDTIAEQNVARLRHHGDLTTLGGDRTDT